MSKINTDLQFHVKFCQQIVLWWHLANGTAQCDAFK